MKKYSSKYNKMIKENNHKGYLEKTIYIEIGDILYTNNDLDEYLGDIYRDLDTTTLPVYCYYNINASDESTGYRGGARIYDLVVDFSKIINVIPKQYQDDFKNDIDRYVYSMQEDIEMEIEKEEDERDYYNRLNAAEARFEERRLRQFESKYYNTNTLSVNEGDVIFKHGKELYDTIDNELSKAGDVYLVRFYCDNDYLVVSVPRLFNRAQIDDIIEKYCYFYYDAGASEGRILITYKKDNGVFEDTINEGKIADFIKKFALSATLATSCLTALANAPVQATDSQIAQAKNNMEVSIQQKLKTPPIVFTARSSKDYLAYSSLQNKILQAEKLHGMSLRYVNIEKYHNKETNTYLYIAYMVDINSSDNYDINDAIDFDYIKYKTSAKKYWEQKLGRECKCAEGFGSTEKEAKQKANAEVNKLKQQGYNYMAHFKHYVMENGNHAFVAFMLKQ